MGSTGAYVIGRQFDEVSAFAEFENAGDAVGWVVRGDEREPGPVVGPPDQAAFYRAVGAALLSDDPQAGMPVDPRDAVHVLPWWTRPVPVTRVSGSSRSSRRARHPDPGVGACG